MQGGDALKGAGTTVCGLCGWLSWNAPPRADVVASMNSRMIHRGPDAEGVVSRGPIVLGHRRLSVIDLSDAADQPMFDADRTCCIAYNGEIYNFPALRRDLEAAGARFRTGADTEVVLEAYKHWGDHFLERLNGMFAFALWDERRQRLLLARDRLGEKPLFYYDDGEGGLIFASELKALLAHPAVKRTVDPQALGQFLSLNYTLTDRCAIAGITKLPPACYLSIERGKTPQINRYWDLEPHFHEKARHRSEREAAEELAALIDDAVRLRMIADVPLGAFLSGGIDSSAIASAMTRAEPRERIKTFSIGFREKSYSELGYARRAASALAVHHTDQVVDDAKPQELEHIVRLCDEPLADTSIIPVYYLSALSRQSVTVCLSGDGSDEIFAGYDTYAADRLHHLSRFVSPWISSTLARAVNAVWPVSFSKVSGDYKLRQFLRGHGLPFDRAHYSWRTIFSESEKASLVHPDWRDAVNGTDPFESFRPHYDATANCHYIDQAMYVDIKTWLPNDILAKVDRATMAHSLESRAPFLDHRIVEFAASLPIRWKLRGFEKKRLLKQSQRGYLPREIVARRKRGFNAPVSHWLLGKFGVLARDITKNRDLMCWFDPRYIERMWEEHETKRGDHGLKLFGLMYWGLWLRQMGLAA